MKTKKTCSKKTPDVDGYEKWLKTIIPRYDKREISSYGVRLEAKKRFNVVKADATIRAHIRKVKAGETIKDTRPPATSDRNRNKEGELSIKSNGNEGQYLESWSDKVKTVAQALKKGGVDLKTWDVERFLVNSWEMGSRLPNGKITVTPLWQVKVWLKPKKGWSTEEFKAKLADDMRKLAPVYRAPKRAAAYANQAPLLAELSIFDAHFGKLAWKAESGDNYDLKICQSRYMAAAEDLLSRVSILRPERILYVVGNDFFHADRGRAGETANGTPQDCDGRWQKAFRKGVECAIRVAEIASHVAPVDILCVPGNHDEEKSFCLGEVLGARFHNSPTVTVTNNPSAYSYYKFGKVLLGFTHGDAQTSERKRQQLPATMATDCPRDWAEAICREWHLGHLHSEIEEVWKHRTVECIREVAVRVLPSLSGTDAWHRKNNYKSVMAAECHVYHKLLGRYGYLVHQAHSNG